MGEYPSQVQVEGYPLLGVPHLGYPPIRPGWGVPLQGGTPPWVPPIRPGWGYPCQGFTSGYPPCQTWLGGYPTLGTPRWTWLGGTPCRGYPNWGTPPPPVGPGRGGTSCRGGGLLQLGYPADTPPPAPPPTPRVIHGVLDTPWSICLLRSRRRTFLF